MIPLGILASSVRVATLVEPTPPLPTVIGEPYGGGFYAGDITYEDGRSFHLIVADKSADTLGLTWGVRGVNLATSHDDGVANTDLMLLQSNPLYAAAAHCSNHRGGGNTDWYMPAINELNILYLNLSFSRASIPSDFEAGGPQAFDSTDYLYWSSTHFDTGAARRQNFFDGGVTTNTASSTNKESTSRRTRPIRRIAFTP